MSAPMFQPPLAGAAPHQIASWDAFLSEVQRVIDLLYTGKADIGALIAAIASSPLILTNVGGTASAMTAEIPASLGLSEVPVGMPFALRAVGVNPGPVELSINGGAFRPVLDGRGRQLVGGELTAATPLWLRPTGDGTTEYRIMSSLIHPADLTAEAVARADGDMFARARANHTGLQPISTVNGLPDALDGLSQASIDGDAALAQQLAAEEAARIEEGAEHKALAEAAFQPAPFSGEFPGDGSKIPDVSFALGAKNESGEDVIFLPFDQRARPYATIEREFYNGGDQERLALVRTTDDSPPLIIDGWDKDGVQIVGGGIAALQFEFYNGGIQDQLAVARVTDDPEPRIFEGWDENGAQIVGGGGAPTPPPPPEPEPIDNAGFQALGYSDGTNLMLLGSPDEVAAPLGDYTASRIGPGSGNAVRAVIDRPMIGPTSLVLGGRGLLVPADPKILYIIIGLGQSLMVGSQSSTSLLSILSVYPEVLMMSRLDGLSDVRLGLVTQDGSGAPALDGDLLVGFEPLVAKVGQGSGGRGETPMEGLANELARAAREVGAVYRTVSFTAAMGGTGYAGLKKGTQTWTNMLTTLTRIKDIAEPLGWQVVVPACVVKHGEADQSNSNYGANLIEWRDDADHDIKEITGQMADVHFILSQPSTHYNRTPRSVMAMLELHNSSPYHHLCGADYPFGEFYASDLLHLLGPGYLGVGQGQMARAYKQACWSSDKKSKITQIIAGARSGNTVVLDYEVPVPPLVLDTMQVDDPGQYGFRFWNGSTEVAITSVALTGPAQVTLTLASAPPGTGGRVEYALTGHSGQRLWETRPRGNLRDSDPSRISYENYPNPNWAVHQPFDL